MAETVQTGLKAASEQPWIEQMPGVQMKVLAVDEARNGVEYLLKLAPGYDSGRHRHNCETFVYVIEGSILNETTGVEFQAGDFCYQAHGDDHVEKAGSQGALILGSLRGGDEALIEFFDASGAVVGKVSVADYAALVSS